MKRLITINEAARIKGVSRQAIHAAIKCGRLPVIEVPSIELRIAPDALENLIVNPKKQNSGRRSKVLTITQTTN